MTRVLIAGDTHGELEWCKRLVKYAKKHKIKTILQVGDFGYWPHTNRGQTFLVELSKCLVEANIKWHWVDGNHENFDWLDAEGAFRASGPRETYPNIIYMPRGYSWVWAGTKFLALGGAASIDKRSREPGSTWWPDEVIGMQDAERACRAGKVDVMVTHDCPMKDVPVPNLKMDHAASNQNREVLGRVVEEVRPRLVMHGHYHQRFSGELRIGDHLVRVEGLGRDGQGAKGFFLLDVANLIIEHPKDW